MNELLTSMVNVFFDNQVFKFQKFGGISRYFAELIDGLRHTKDISVIPDFFFSDNKHLRYKKLTKFNKLNDSRNFRGRKRIKDYLKEREAASMKRKIKGGNFNIFHPTYYDPYFLEYLPPGKPFVLTVHDMIHETYYDPKDNLLSNETKQKRILIPLATRIVAVSEKTKGEILRLFPDVSCNKIEVVYHGSSLDISSSKIKGAISSKYILYVGHRTSQITWLKRK
jgi:hypothetical protein